MSKLEHVLRGTKKVPSKQTNTSKPHLPMTPNILLKLRFVWEEEAANFDHNMLWAACCTCYFRILTSGEINVPSEKKYDPSTHLSFRDITVTAMKTHPLSQSR